MLRLVMQRLNMVYGDVSMIDKHCILATNIGPTDVVESPVCIARRVVCERELSGVESPRGTALQPAPSGDICVHFVLVVLLESQKVCRAPMQRFPGYRQSWKRRKR